jgi:DNA repair exonuclease SbcCD ATPase subunit
MDLCSTDNMGIVPNVIKEYKEQFLLYSEYVKFTNKIKHISNQLEKLKDPYPIWSVEALQEKIDTLDSVTSEMESNIERYTIYQEYITKINELKQLENNLKTFEAEYLQLLNYSKHISEAETIAINNILDLLNYNVNRILNEFDLPMQFKIEIIAGKVDLEVTNAGMDDLELSGGEHDRLNLAITIALNSLDENSPILMLDESISSLDSINVEKVLVTLGKYSKDKLILVVLHSAIEGNFDQVINLVR